METICWQDTQAYIQELCKDIWGVTNCTFDCPSVVGASNVKRRPCSPEDCVICANSFSCVVRGRLPDTCNDIVLFNVPIPVDNTYFVVRGKRYIIVKFLNTARLLPLMPDGACLTAQGKVVVKNGTVTVVNKPCVSENEIKERHGSAWVEHMKLPCKYMFDQDDMSSKRILLPFYVYCKLLKSVLHRFASKKLSHNQCAAEITRTLEYHISTGIFPGQQVGATQLYSPVSPLMRLRQRNKVISRGIDKILKSRLIREDQFGLLCPVDTPEGASIGVSRSLAESCELSTFSPPQQCIDVLQKGSGVAFVNGILFSHINVEQSACVLRQQRKKGLIHRHVSVCLHGNELWIWTDAGRLGKGTPWRFVGECPNAHVPAHSILSPMAQTAGRFIGHNQCARATFQCSQCAQAIPMHQPMMTCADTYKQLWYGQRALVDSHNLLHGVNVIVAVMTHEGSNMEDGIVINQGAVDRGLFRSSWFASKVSPNICQSIRDTDGGVPINTYIAPGQVDHKRYGPSRVNACVIHKDGGVTMQLRYDMTLQAGDKLASRHGQKGVISRVVPEIDMPFAPHSNMRPDVLINPAAFPSRMTIGMLMEMGLAKLSACSGKHCVPQKPFEHNSTVEQICEALHNQNLKSDGTEIMYCGKTGERIKSRIFMGPCMYSRLVHDVLGKVYARGAVGHIDPVTQQPNEGRKQNGGLRIGEMEFDSLIAHGAGAVIEDVHSRSDLSVQTICKNCKVLHTMRNGQCIQCKQMCGVKINIPACTAALANELLGMHVQMKFDI